MPEHAEQHCIEMPTRVAPTGDGGHLITPLDDATPDLLAACEAVLAQLDYLRGLWGDEAITRGLADQVRGGRRASEGRERMSEQYAMGPNPWAWMQGVLITCYEITHGGEGERGREVDVVTTPNSGSHVAEQAAEYFDDIDKQTGDLTDSDLDGTSRVIEVCGVYSRPVRYRVRCRVSRSYDADQLTEAKGEGA